MPTEPTDEEVIAEALACRPEFGRDKCLEQVKEGYGEEFVANASDELKDDLVLIAKLDHLYEKVMEDAAKRGARLSPGNEMAAYVNLVVDALLPRETPERIALEKKFRMMRTSGVVAAKRQLDEAYGRPRLVLPDAPKLRT